MNEKRYYWLRLKEDFFSSKRIKKIRSIAGGDTYTIIYLKMLLKALKNDGYLYFDGVMNDFAEEIALDIDEKPDDVKVTIQLLNSIGLIEHSEDTDVYKLTYMDMMIGSETATTQRVRDFRARRKALQCNTDETEVKHLGNVEIEKEIEKEIDIECKEKRKRFIPPTLEEVKAYVKERNSSVDPKRFFEYYETGKWKDAKGQPVRNWKQKLITWEKKESKPNKFCDHPQSDTDLEDLEKRIFAN